MAGSSSRSRSSSSSSNSKATETAETAESAEAAGSSGSSKAADSSPDSSTDETPVGPDGGQTAVTTQGGEPLGGTEVVADVPAPVPTEDHRPSGKQGGSPTAYLNVTNGPVVYDLEGHTVDAAGGPESWTPEINLDPIGQQARDRGYLVPKSAL